MKPSEKISVPERPKYIEIKHYILRDEVQKRESRSPIYISTDEQISRRFVNVYAIIIVLCISIDNSNIRTRSLRNTHSQETQHLSWETL
jgi:hypothetical protein